MNFKCFVVFKKKLVLFLEDAGVKHLLLFLIQIRTEQNRPFRTLTTTQCYVGSFCPYFFFNKMCPAQTVRKTITNKVWLWILYLYDAAASRCCLHCLQQDGVWIRSTATNTGKDDSAAPAPGHSGRNAVRRTVGVSISFRHDVVKEEKKICCNLL